MQRVDAWSEEVSLERYLERCELKTARLFEAACRLGAVLGGSDGGWAVEPLAWFGARIGLAFQIFDDVLDVSGPAERTGKHRGTDLLDGTVTLPLIVARRRDPELRELDLRRAVSDPAAAEALCERIALTGALNAAREQALAYVAAAKAALDATSLSGAHRRTLSLVADGVVERYA
jgi:geranylgeranyl pyrophosphate synthase